MTRKANARLAGITFLLYIVAGIANLAIGQSKVTALLTIVTSLCALVLGVTLYAITRDEDPDLALIALTCRVVEAIPTEEGRVNAIFFAVGSTLFAWLLLKGRMIPAALAWLGIIASPLLLVLLLLQHGGLFAAGSSWSSSLTWIIWLPMLVFEVWLAFWLIVRGVAAGPSRAVE